MTSRGKNAVRGFETDIEKSREEANWKKAIELAQQLKARSPQHESLAHFLIGEGKLEEYLEQWPPTKDNIPRARRELSDARGYLTLATDEVGKKAGVALDAHLLLGKLNYACGDYDDALKHYKLAELDTLTEKELPVRSLRIVAESFAIKGLCLEMTDTSSATRYQQAEREAEMVRNVEVSSSLALVYLQVSGGRGAHPLEAALSAGGWPGHILEAALSAGGWPGHILEAALQRAALLHVRAHRLTQALDRYREMLRAVEAPSTQGLRLTLARQLAELLLRGVTGQVYRPPCIDRGGGTLSRRNDEGPWKPRKYTSINQFVPQNEYEEVLLCVMVGEAMGVRSAVLSQSEEFRGAREHAARAARGLSDLLAVSAARWGLRGVVIESLERAMKFSFGCSHPWRQRALACLAAAGGQRGEEGEEGEDGEDGEEGGATPPDIGSSAWHRMVRAARVTSRACALRDHAALRLLAAHNYYQMCWVEEGILESEAALRLAEAGPDDVMTARCCLQAARGLQALAQKTRTRVERNRARAKSYEYLMRAVKQDSNSSLTHLHLALHHAALGELNEAMEWARQCLVCEGGSAGGLRLVGRLWADGPLGRQVRLLAHHDHPTKHWRLAGPQMTLEEGKQLLALVYSEAEEPGPRYRDLDQASEPRDDALSCRDTVSVRGSSVRSGVGAGGSRAGVGAAAGGGAGSVGGRGGRGQEGRRARAWLMLADVCLRQGRAGAASGCVAEAAALAPLDYQVFYTRGRVHLALREWQEAVSCFQDALAIHPTHVDTMARLGEAYFQQGWLGLAETWVRAACVGAAGGAGGGGGVGGAGPWAALGGVLLARGDAAQAADAASAALHMLSRTTPPHTH